MNPIRTAVIASNVFREVIRDRALYLIGFFAIAIVSASVLLPKVSAGTGNKIILDVGLAAIGILGMLIAVFVGTGLVNKEIEKRTVYVMIAKPISRAEFIVGKHLGLSAVLVVLVAAMTLINLGVLQIQHFSFPLRSILIAEFFQFLELSLITAVAILFGVFTSSLLATLLTIAIYFMGHFSRDLVALGAMSKDPNVQQIANSIYLVLPDLSRLNLRNQAIYGIDLLPQPAELLGNIGYALLYTLLLLTIATLIFSRREF